MIMKKTGRLLGLLLSLALVIGAISFPVSAVSPEVSTGHADTLKALHLFEGTEKGYELENEATRIQGIVMFLRLLGLEDEAMAYTGECPFNDLAAWSVPYVGYAYSVGLTDGVAAGQFVPNRALDAKTYITFLLRGLGYSDARGDFTWAAAVEFAESDAVGLAVPGTAGKMKGVVLTRGDMVSLSYAALTARMAGDGVRLWESLYEARVFSYEDANKTGIVNAYPYKFSYGSEDNAVVESSALKFEERSFDLASGRLYAYVATVDTSDPSVRVESRMVNNTLGATAPFADIVKGSGADLVVNGNFFESYEEFKIPIGHVMVGGEFLYGVSGLSSLGVGENGELQIGRPPLFTRIRCVGSYHNWAAYEVNSVGQNEYNCIMYTPAFGASFVSETEAHILTVRSGAIDDYRPVSAGETVTIPGDGFAVWMPGLYTSTDYFCDPPVGAKVTTEYFLQREDEEGFELD